MGRGSSAAPCVFLAHYRSVSGKMIDQVVALFFPAGRAYTGEDSLEIDCHGNPLIIRSIIEDLRVSGCRGAEPGEFTKRAYLNRRIDLCQAEAVLDVIHATNKNALEIAQKQLRGALSEKIFHLNDALLGTLAEIEVYIDFTDEEWEWDEKISEKLEGVLLEIDEIMGSHRFRRALFHGISVAIVGHPNAGKSSLLNALLGEERALVSDIPGTTRDFISENITIEGFFVKIIDTAGLRATNDTIEQLGIQKTIANIRAADLCLIVVDQNDPQPLAEEMIGELQKKQCILVVNKIDLFGKISSNFCKELRHLPRTFISAKRGTGLDALKAAIANKIRECALLPEDVAVAINERHREIFRDVRNLIFSAKNTLENQRSYELCASDLRLVLETLGCITGKYDAEKLLDKIFSQFCVGK